MFSPSEVVGEGTRDTEPNPFSLARQFYKNAPALYARLQWRKARGAPTRNESNGKTDPKKEKKNMSKVGVSFIFGLNTAVSLVNKHQQASLIK